MAADFDFYAYQSNDGEVRRVKLAVTGALAQPTTATAGVTATVDGSAIAGGSRRALGVHCRGFRLKRVTGKLALTRSRSQPSCQSCWRLTGMMRLSAVRSP